MKAFTGDSSKGNPAGVVHGADQLHDEQMLSIAQTLGFSESAFIQKSQKADYRVRFFTPKQEVNFCGHATVATFCSLVSRGIIEMGDEAVKVVTQETKAGIFPVSCYLDGKVMMTQANPVFGEIESDKQLIAKLLNLNESDIGALPIQIVTTVTPTFIVPIASLEALRNVQPDLEAIYRYTEQKNAGCLYLFTTESLSANTDMCTRSFDPLVGINEDAATGAAAGPLGCYADKYVYEGSKKQLVIQQGFDMGMDSTLYVDIENEVQVGGYGASFGARDLKI